MLLTDEDCTVLPVASDGVAAVPQPQAPPPPSSSQPIMKVGDNPSLPVVGADVAASCGVIPFGPLMHPFFGMFSSELLSVSIVEHIHGCFSK